MTDNLAGEVPGATTVAVEAVAAVAVEVPVVVREWTVSLSSSPVDAFSGLFDPVVSLAGAPLEGDSAGAVSWRLEVSALTRMRKA